MIEGEVDADRLAAICQVIGVAYTYQPSLSTRRHLTKNITAHHSSKHLNFSYFYKGDGRAMAGHRQDLHLRTDPASGASVKHWPEPELAALLGERHEIVAYTLANDLTAIGLEARGRTGQTDGTYVGKVWYRSGSVGPKFVAASSIGDAYGLDIGLKVRRRGRVVYDQKYNTSRRLRPFAEMPDAIVNYRKQFGGSLPPSKDIMVGPRDYLPAGTLLMLGTGLIVQDRYFCEDGDRLTVYSPAIGELTNTVVAAG